MSQNSLKTNNIDSKCQGIPRSKIRDDKNVKAVWTGRTKCFPCTVTQSTLDLMKLVNKTEIHQNEIKHIKHTRLSLENSKFEI